MSERHVVQFSCGAASAVAAKLILSEIPKEKVLIVNAFVEEEHEDNRRFLSDCERWFDHPVTVVRSDKYHASAREVWARRKFMVGHYTAPCSEELKRKPLGKLALPGDVTVIGYTSEEEERADRLSDLYPSESFRFPLLERGLSKADTLAMIERADIQLPEMYRRGYSNANCIGCVKGGEGYWNKIRIDFPERFIQISNIQEEIGPGAYFFRDRKTGERISLKNLDPEAGRDQKEPEISCSFLCSFAEQDIEAAERKSNA